MCAIRIVFLILLTHETDLQIFSEKPRSSTTETEPSQQPWSFSLRPSIGQEIEPPGTIYDMESQLESVWAGRKRLHLLSPRRRAFQGRYHVAWCFCTPCGTWPAGHDLAVDLRTLSRPGLSDGILQRFPSVSFHLSEMMHTPFLQNFAELIRELKFTCSAVLVFHFKLHQIISNQTPTHTVDVLLHS